jgi:hypothetical protein
VNLTKIIAGAAISGALGLTSFGLGAGVANADSPAPAVTWQQDGGHGDGRGAGDSGASGYEPGAACFMGPFWHAYCL